MENELIFTRYLYSKSDVEQSLLICLLEHNYDASLFWAYELYYSGFQIETFEFLLKIFNDIYISTNGDLSRFIQNAYDSWKNNADDCLIGSIVATLCIRNYILNGFIATYFKVKCLDNDTPTSKRLVIHLKDANIVDHKTKPNTVGKMRLYLKDVCKYGVIKDFNHIFGNDCLDLREQFYYNWIYYAANSPIWAERMKQFAGGKCSETKKIVFANDDMEEDFYNNWGLEPDEQSVEIQNKCIGNYNKQLSIKEFCQRFGVKIITKTVKLKSSKLDK